MYYKFEQAVKLLASQNIPIGKHETKSSGGFDFDAAFVRVAGFDLTAGQIVRLYEEGQLNLQGIHAFAEHAGMEAHPST